MQEAAAVSPWLDVPDPVAAPLSGDREADVAVLGAGFAGLSSALALRREGLEVVVLEARQAGFGASGRNAGHLTPTIGKDLPTLMRLYGRERVGALVALAEAAISHVESSIRDLDIQCDYEPVGNVVAAVHPSQHGKLDRAAEAAAAHGVPGEILERDEMERRGLPRAFTRGYLEPHGGILHPGRYLAGLRSAALAAGVRLFEGSPARRIDEGPTVVIHTPNGRVRARHAVIATNAYTPELGRLRSAGMRLQVQLFQTEPLDAEQREALGWRGREGIYTAHEILESYRWTPDGRILGGSKAVRAGFGGRQLADVDPGVSALLERTFGSRFPELGGVRIARHWGGPIFMGLDFLPAVGRSGAKGNVLHAVAFAGHGVSLASYAGEMIADLLLGRSGLGETLWSRRTLPTPPEPFRSLAFHAFNAVFSCLDRRVDRRVARRRGGP
jgi:glycine/D-amino acid oxidase-like deaminating enzyme